MQWFLNFLQRPLFVANTIVEPPAHTFRATAPSYDTKISPTQTNRKCISKSTLMYYHPSSIRRASPIGAPLILGTFELK